MDAAGGTRSLESKMREHAPLPVKTQQIGITPSVHDDKGTERYLPIPLYAIQVPTTIDAAADGGDEGPRRSDRHAPLDARVTCSCRSCNAGNVWKLTCKSLYSHVAVLALLAGHGTLRVTAATALVQTGPPSRGGRVPFG